MFPVASHLHNYKVSCWKQGIQVSLGTTKPRWRQSCGLSGALGYLSQLLQITSYSLAPNLLPSSNQQNSDEPFSHAIAAISLRLLPPHFKGPRTIGVCSDNLGRSSFGPHSGLNFNHNLNSLSTYLLCSLLGSLRWRKRCLDILSHCWAYHTSVTFSCGFLGVSTATIHTHAILERVCVPQSCKIMEPVPLTPSSLAACCGSVNCAHLRLAS